MASLSGSEVDDVLADAVLLFVGDVDAVVVVAVGYLADSDSFVEFLEVLNIHPKCSIVLLLQIHFLLQLLSP